MKIERLNLWPVDSSHLKIEEGGGGGGVGSGGGGGGEDDDS